MKYKIDKDVIYGYQGSELVLYLFIADPVSRSKYILDLSKTGELHVV
tara:strand:- start:11530 stop:11670 length:141 start_codon:yes stop_codon:yes gene_type:complete